MKIPAITPGPWHVFVSPQSGKTYVVTLLPGESTFHRGQIIAYPTTCPNHEANAHLIAAAPQLLRALESVEHYLADACDQGILDLHPAFAEWENVRAVMAQAKGAV